ncbi:MAG TPA: DMT family transporter [Candidatus Acidoferrales bacterium]|nr:DMT family transporter [Candidatus Acidoferrales bacterium]
MSDRFKAEMGLAFATLVWGGTFVASKAGLSYISPMAFVAARSVLGGFVLLVFFRSVLPRIRLGELKAGALIGMFLFLGYACLTVGLAYTTAAKAAFINSFEAVLPAVLLAVVWRKPGPPLLWVGAFAATAGLYLISVPSGGISGLNRGDVLVLCGALLFSFHTITLGILTARHEVGALTLLQVGTTATLALFALPVFALSGLERPRVEVTPVLVLALLLSGVGSMAIGLTIQTWAQRHTPASHAALYFSLIPVFAALASYLFLGERMGGREMAGGGCIFAGVLMASVSRPGSSQPQPPTPDAVEFGVGGGL